MSKGKDQHIVPHSEGWAVQAEGATKRIHYSARSDCAWTRDCYQSAI